MYNNFECGMLGLEMVTLECSLESGNVVSLVCWVYCEYSNIRK
jgi:hypothetical protein